MKQVDFNLLKEKLPEFPELIDKDEYLNASVLIPFVKINNSYHLLFEKRAANIRQGGEVSFPGGEFDIENHYCPVKSRIKTIGYGSSSFDLSYNFY